MDSLADCAALLALSIMLLVFSCNNTKESLWIIPRLVLFEHDTYGHYLDTWKVV